LILPEDGFDLVLPELKYSDAAEAEAFAAARASVLIEE